MPRAALSDLAHADRVLIDGVTGSGKSTAAVRLGGILGLPVHLVDDEIGWLPGWVPRPAEEQRVIAATIAAEPRWVIDSTYGNFRDLVLPHADVIVSLDYPRWLSLARLVRRTATQVVRRTPTCNGNVETWRQLLEPDSILRWHFQSFARKRERARAWESSGDGPPVLRLSHPRDLTAVVAGLESLQRS